MRNKNTKFTELKNTNTYLGFAASRLVFQNAPRVKKKIEKAKDLSASEVNLQLKHLQDDVDGKWGEIFHNIVTSNGPTGEKANYQNWYNEEDFSLAEEELMHYVKRHPQKHFFKKIFFTLNRKGFNKDNQEYVNAKNAFKAFMFMLENSAKQLKNNEKVVSSVRAKSEPTIDKLKKFGGELVRSYKEGDAWDKGAIILSGVVLYKIYQSNKDKKFLGTDYTWKEIAEYAGGYWAINVMAIKMTGKSLMEHAGIKDVRDDLKNTDFAKFTHHFEIEDRDQIDVMLGAADIPMHRLINLYQNANPQNREIDPIRAGYPGAAKMRADKKDYKDKARYLYAMMEKFQKQVKGNWKQYADSKRGYTVLHFLTREMKNVDLIAKHGLIDRMVEKAYGVLGKKGYSLDIQKFHEEVQWPEDWKAQYVTKDVETVTGETDSTFEMKINHIPVIVKRVRGQGARKDKFDYVFQIKFTGKSQRVHLEPGGKLNPQHKDLFMHVMKHDVARRIRNVNLKYEDAVTGRKRRMMPNDIKWDASDSVRAWTANRVEIPKTDFHPGGAGDAVISPRDGNGVSIQVRGANIDIVLENFLINASPEELSIINDLNTSGEFGKIFMEVAGKLQFPSGHFKPAVKAIKGKGGKNARAILQVGNAQLPLEYKSLGGKKHWHVAKKGKLTPAEALKDFVTSDDFIKAKVDGLKVNSPLDKTIEGMEQNIYAAAESHGKHFAKSFRDYVGSIFNGKDVPAPTLGGVSGSVIQNYGTSRLDGLRQEVLDLYEYQLERLKNRSFSKPSDVVAAVSSIETNLVKGTVANLKGHDIAFKAENKAKVLNKGYWQTPELMEKLNLSGAINYQNSFYGPALERARQEFYTLDFQGLDKSDFMMKGHVIREHLVRVVAYRTRSIAMHEETVVKAGVDLNGDGIIEKNVRISADDTDFSKYTANRDKYAPGVREYKIWDNCRKASIDNFKRQMYMEYVINQVFNKALAFGHGPIDNVIKQIHMYPPLDERWEIDEFENWKEFGPKPEKMGLINAPKLSEARVETFMQIAIKATYQRALATGDYQTLALKKVRSAYLKHIVDKTGGGDSWVEAVAKLPTRYAQETALIEFKGLIHGAFFEDTIKRGKPNKPGYISRILHWSEKKLRRVGQILF